MIIIKKILRILHFLFNQNIIIILQILEDRDYKFCIYRYNSKNAKERQDSKTIFFKKLQILLQNVKIEQELLSIDENIFASFDMKCQSGENDSYISELIRNDSVEEFVCYANLPLDSRITDSISETKLIETV